MRRLARIGLGALALACVAASSVSAQQVRQQSMPPRFDVDSAMARATMLRRQNRKAEAERVMRARCTTCWRTRSAAARRCSAPT